MDLSPWYLDPQSSVLVFRGSKPVDKSPSSWGKGNIKKEFLIWWEWGDRLGETWALAQSHLCLDLIHPFRCWLHPLTPTRAGAQAELVQRAQGIQSLSTLHILSIPGSYPALRPEVREWGTGRSVALPPWLFKIFLYFKNRNREFSIWAFPWLCLEG